LVFRKLLVFVIAVAIAAFSCTFDPFFKWKKKRRDAFAEHQFHEQLFEKVQGLQNFSCLISFRNSVSHFSIIDLLSGSNEVETKQRLNNVIFMLDVSNSMNAEDVEPIV
jgi:Ca-activated chloride channel family protein